MNKAHVFWFTGLSGAGKTTIAEAVSEKLKTAGFNAMLLDGDKVRDARAKALGFTPEDIEQNNMMIAEACLEYQNDFDVIMVPVISPFELVRQKIKQKLAPNCSIIYFSASVDTVAGRDVKGLYSKAKSGLITNMIGFSKQDDQYVVPFEKPIHPDLEINSDDGIKQMELNISKLEKFIISKIKE